MMPDVDRRVQQRPTCYRAALYSRASGLPAGRRGLDKWPGHLITFPQGRKSLRLGGGRLEIVEVETYPVRSKQQNGLFVKVVTDEGAATELQAVADEATRALK